MALAVVIVILVVGSIIFHFASPWWFTDIAADWGTVDFVIDVTFWVTGFVFIAVNLFLAYCVWKFRQAPGHKAVYEPENSKLEVSLSVVTAVGVVLMLAPGLFVWATFVSPPDDAYDVEIIGSQWQWQFRYPGADGVLGTADTQYINEANPWGVNPEDPNGQDDVVIDGNEMHLPVDTDVRGLLRSKDVLHNYTVPQFRVKMDMVPGLVSYLWFRTTASGSYDIMCEEMCGIAHFMMRGNVVVEPRADFEAWLAQQPTFAETQSVAAPSVAAGQQAYAACATCHGPNAEGNQALNAPRLAGLQSWYLERQLNYFKTGVRGGQNDSNGAMMAPMAMGLDDNAIRNLSAYIASLPARPATGTITDADIDNGARIYSRNCAACHLDNGEGTWYTDAPHLAGMSDWYFVNQINNFRQKIRGAHANDLYGEQMVWMATAMADQDEVEDVAAYLNSLR
ncbi:MAG: cytochrome c oxidase subunit II [Gammaproteobacteria bacterium]|nr:cytochrome c oxidase subunit II [Pseudomonadales bacterium]MCP5347782.1 cytochrome c oxidase subunit II [Pseudomonadales bacterium]